MGISIVIESCISHILACLLLTTFWLHTDVELSSFQVQEKITKIRLWIPKLIVGTYFNSNLVWFYVDVNRNDFLLARLDFYSKLRIMALANILSLSLYLLTLTISFMI